MYCDVNIPSWDSLFEITALGGKSLYLFSVLAVRRSPSAAVELEARGRRGTGSSSCAQGLLPWCRAITTRISKHLAPRASAATRTPQARQRRSVGDRCLAAARRRSGSLRRGRTTDVANVMRASLGASWVLFMHYGCQGAGTREAHSEAGGLTRSLRNRPMITLWKMMRAETAQQSLI